MRGFTDLLLEKNDLLGIQALRDSKATRLHSLSDVTLASCGEH